MHKVHEVNAGSYLTATVILLGVTWVCNVERKSRDVEMDNGWVDASTVTGGRGLGLGGGGWAVGRVRRGFVKTSEVGGFWVGLSNKLTLTA